MKILVVLFLSYLVVAKCATGIWCGKPYGPQDQGGAVLLVKSSFNLYFPSEKTGKLLVFFGNVSGNHYFFKAFVGNDILVGKSTIGISAGFQRFEYSFMVGDLEMGENQVRSVIVDANDTVVTESVTTLRKYDRRDNVVRVDGVTGGLIVDDLPFFPMGFYLEYKDPTYIPNVRNEVMNGFNAPLGYRPPSIITQDYINYLDLLKSWGMKGIYDMYGIGEQKNTPEKFSLIESNIKKIKDHPALLAYYIADEPDGPGLDPEIVKQTYLFIKKLDPYHPVLIVLNCEFSILHYQDYADLVMTDPYPISMQQPDGCDNCKGNVLDISNRLSSLHSQNYYQKNIWTVLQAFGGTEHWSRQPSPDEIRMMSYLSITNDAKGIIYFLEGIPFGRSMWGEARRLTMEIRELTPWLLSSSKSPVSLSISPSTIQYKTYYHKSTTYLVIVNPEKTTAVAAVSFDKNYHFEIFRNAFDDEIIEFSQDMTLYLGPMSRIVIVMAEKEGQKEIKNNNLAINPDFSDCPTTAIPDGYSFGNIDQYGGSAFSLPTRSKTGLHSLYWNGVNTTTPRVMKLYPILLCNISTTYQFSITAAAFSSAKNNDLKSITIALSVSTSQKNYTIPIDSTWHTYTLPLITSTDYTMYYPNLYLYTDSELFIDTVSFTQTDSTNHCTSNKTSTTV